LILIHVFFGGHSALYDNGLQAALLPRIATAGARFPESSGVWHIP
jgi:hypothetical protein